jgi:hypothetical protein
MISVGRQVVGGMLVGNRGGDAGRVVESVKMRQPNTDKATGTRRIDHVINEHHDLLKRSHQAGKRSFHPILFPKLPP